MKKKQEGRFELGILQLQTDALESTATRDLLITWEFLMNLSNFHQAYSLPKQSYTW